MQAEQLGAEFRIAGVLDFVNVGDLVKAVVTTDGTTGELFLQGATITRWDPAGGRPAIFVSPKSIFAPGTAIRGGIPVIFPWFGPHKSAKEAPQHGFVRTAPWRLDGVERGAGSVTLTLSVGSDEVTSPYWPEPYRAVYAITFGRTLSLSFTVQNRAPRPVAFEEALHTYFAVSDVAQIAVSGLDGRTYIDKTDAMQRKTQHGDVRLAKETDSLYLDTPDRRAIEDAAWNRRIVVDSSNARSTIVWNLWAEKAAAMRDMGDQAWRDFVCVETGNAADNEVRLGADSEHKMTTQYAVDAVG